MNRGPTSQRAEAQHEVQRRPIPAFNSTCSLRTDPELRQELPIHVRERERDARRVPPFHRLTARRTQPGMLFRHRRQC